jgi:hypothetical protein
MTTQNQLTLDQHMAMLGRIVARFVSTGLLPVNIGSREIEKFLGQSEDQKTFEAVVSWMLDEDIIRAKDVHVFQRRIDCSHRRATNIESPRDHQAAASYWRYN